MSSFPELRVFPYADVAAILPQERKETCKNKANAAKAEYVGLEGWNIEDGKKTSKEEIITTIAGACILFVGLLLTLAFHQILPFGINSIGCQVAGYICLGAGLIALLVGAVRGCINGVLNTKVDGVMDTYYLAEVAEMGSCFPSRLQHDELFAVHDSSRHEITIYSKERNADDDCYERMNPITFKYSTTPQEAFQSWCRENAAIVMGKHFIDLNTLDQQTQEFERKQRKRKNKIDEQTTEHECFTSQTTTGEPPKPDLAAKLKALKAKFEDLKEIALTRMTQEAWEDHKESLIKAAIEESKTVEEVELEILTEAAIKAIKTNLDREHQTYVEPTKEQLTEAIDSLKRERLINDLYERRPERKRSKEIQEFYKSKGENYDQTPLVIDIANFQDKKVNGEWPIDWDQVGILDWKRDRSLETIGLDDFIINKIELREETVAPLRVSFKMAFQYVANKIEYFSKNPRYLEDPRIVKIDRTPISSALTNIDFIPRNPLTGKGGISWADAIFLMLKQEGYVFDISKRDEVFLQV